MKRGWIVLLLVLFLTFLLAESMTVFGKTTEAPGGQVRNETELAAALGGESAVQIREDHILLFSDICLKQPVEILTGEYTLIGAGCEITADYSDGDFFILGGEGATTLTLGRPDSQTDNDSLGLDGGVNAREGSLIHIEEDATLVMYVGTVLQNNFTQITGGAIHCDGSFYMMGGTIRNCRSYGSGGGVFSRGTLYLAGGLILDSSAEYGGAVYNQGEAILAGTELKNCAASCGGLVFNSYKLQLASSSLSVGKAHRGGGIYNSGDLTAEGGQVISCLSEDGEGGGIYNSGIITLSGTYISGNQALTGGNIYNSGRFSMTEGQLYEGKADGNGGHVFNDTTGELTVAGGTIGRGTAAYGGGVFNLGTMTVKKGSFSSNSAQAGEAILNDGTLIFSEYPYIDKKNDVFLVIDEGDPHAIRIESEMKADCIALLTPGILSDGNYQAFCMDGYRLLTGDYAEQGSSHFMITDFGDQRWKLESDGTAVAKVSFIRTPWPYLLILIAFTAIVLLLVVLIRLSDRRRKKMTL